MRKILVVLITLAIYKAAFIWPSYGMDDIEFREKDYTSCIKGGHSLYGYSLNKSYQLCYKYFSSKYNQINSKIEPTLNDVLTKCSYAIALSEILLKPLQSEVYGINGENIQNIIGYLNTFLNVCNDYLDQPLSDDYNLQFKTQQRYATLYATMLSIKLEKWFPGNVTLQEFTNHYERLKSVQSANHTGTIQLYMAHLIVYNNVRPNMISDQEALELAFQLTNSTFKQKNDNSDPIEKLYQALTKKQKDQSVETANSVYTTPSLTTMEEREHRNTIIEHIHELIKAARENQQEEESITPPSQHLIPNPKKRKLVIHSDDEDDHGNMPNIQPNITIEPIPFAGMGAQQAQHSEPLKKKRKLVLQDEDEAINIESTQPNLLYQPEFTESIILNVDSQTKDQVGQQSRQKKNPRLVEDHYNSTDVKSYILNEWEKGRNPNIDEIMNALGYKGKATSRRISGYKYVLKEKFPNLVPITPKELTPTQKIINFLLESKNAWQELVTLYVDFNQLYPNLLTEKYFRDHGGPIRSILVRKGAIPNLSRCQSTENFINIATYVEINPLGKFDELHSKHPTINKKYFEEIKSIYRDYAQLFDIEAG